MTHHKQYLTIIPLLPKPPHKALKPLAIRQTAVNDETAFLGFGDCGADFLQEGGFGVEEG